VPDLFDAIDLDTAPLSERGLGEARRDPDPQTAGDELEERPAAGRIERVEPGFEQARDIGAGRPPQLIDYFRKARDITRAARRRGPNQRHGLGEIADKIIGPAQQLGVDPRVSERPHLARLCRSNTSSPVSAAIPAAPGSGTVAKYSASAAICHCATA
jgi:hypothetical protein